MSPADPPSFLRQTGLVALDFGAVSGHPRRPPILVDAISLMLINVHPCPEEVWGSVRGRMLGRVQERPVHRRTTLCVQSRVDEVVRSSSLLLGGRHVAHVSPSLGCRHPERWSGAVMRKPSPTRRRRQRRPSGCAMCQNLQQDGATATLGAAASARRSCILSLTRALQGQCAAAKTWSPSTGRMA